MMNTAKDRAAAAALTDEQIAALRDDAAASGDTGLYCTCLRALDRDEHIVLWERARQTCARAIAARLEAR